MGDIGAHTRECAKKAREIFSRLNRSHMEHDVLRKTVGAPNTTYLLLLCGTETFTDAQWRHGDPFWRDLKVVHDVPF
jgi:hypothetical protein